LGLRDRATGDDSLEVVERVRAVVQLMVDSLPRRGTRESQILDDVTNQRGSLPGIRQHGKHDRVLGNEQQQGLKAPDRALVVEKAVAHPPPERVACAERLADRLVEMFPLPAMS